MRAALPTRDKVLLLYFDHASGMVPDASDIEILSGMYLKYSANQEALHRMAYDVRCALSQAKDRLVRVLAGNPDFRVIAFSGGTAAVALLGKWQRLKRKKVLTTRLEHPSVNSALKRAEAECVYLKPDKYGRVQSLNIPDIDAVFIHHVQSEIGTVQDLETLFAAFPDAIKIADTIQSAVKMPLPRNADILTVSGAKFGVPGAAALLVRKKYAAEIDGLVQAEREDYLVPRLLVPNFLAMSRTADLKTADMSIASEHAVLLQKLSRRLAEKLGLRCTVPEEFSSPYICHISLKDADGAVVVRLLGEEGICAGAGTACSAETGEPSAVLRAIGYSKKDAFGGLRISFSMSTTENDVKKLFEVLEKILKNY